MSYNLLKGKRGIIFGALNEHSIAWKVAERAYEEGATFTLTNVPIALRMGDTQILAEKCHTEVIPADAVSVEDLENLIIKSSHIYEVFSEGDEIDKKSLLLAVGENFVLKNGIVTFDLKSPYNFIEAVNASSDLCIRRGRRDSNP